MTAKVLLVAMRVKTPFVKRGAIASIRIRRQGPSTGALESAARLTSGQEE